MNTFSRLSLAHSPFPPLLSLLRFLDRTEGTSRNKDPQDETVRPRLGRSYCLETASSLREIRLLCASRLLISTYNAGRICRVSMISCADPPPSTGSRPLNYCRIPSSSLPIFRIAVSVSCVLLAQSTESLPSVIDHYTRAIVARFKGIFVLSSVISGNK